MRRIAGTLTACAAVLAVAASCAARPARLPARAVPAAWSDGAIPADEDARSVGDLLDRAESGVNASVEEEARRALGEREAEAGVRRDLDRLLAAAARKLGEESLASARSHLEALELDQALAETDRAADLLGTPPETKDLRGRIVRLRAARDGDAARAALAPQEAFRGRIELAGLLLAKGKSDEALPHLKAAMAQLRAERDETARAQVLREASGSIEASLPELSRQFEGRDYEKAGQRVAEIVERLRTMPGAAAAPASLRSDKVEEIVRAIEAGDFGRAEAASSGGDPADRDLQALRERLQTLRSAIEEK